MQLKSESQLIKDWIHIIHILYFIMYYTTMSHKHLLLINLSEIILSSKHAFLRYAIFSICITKKVLPILIMICLVSRKHFITNLLQSSELHYQISLFITKLSMEIWKIVDSFISNHVSTRLHTSFVYSRRVIKNVSSF